MRFDFWRGIIAGGLLGIMAVIMISPENKNKHRNLLGRVYSCPARQRARQVIKGVRTTIRDVTR